MASQPAVDATQLIKVLFWSCIVVFVLAAGIVGACKDAQNAYRAASDVPSADRPYANAHESTEAKVRRVYESQGIKFDEKMIRDDAKMIERLHRDLNTR